MFVHKKGLICERSLEKQQFVHKRGLFCGWKGLFYLFVHKNTPFCGQIRFLSISASASARKHYELTVVVLKKVRVPSKKGVK